jgi:hypothetical protein
MTNPAIRRWDRETLLVAAFAGGVSLIFFLFYFRRGDVLLYGDAVAHINIARRVFDSHTPGLLQLGTVWLPLPHLLMIPFLFSDWAWQTGVGGSIPSMIAYVFGCVGIFRLVRGTLSIQSVPDLKIKIAAWIAAFIFAINPNLLYLQSTAMTEPLYLALFIWALAHFSEFVQNKNGAGLGSLTKCGLCVVGACLTRYDGWFLAVVLSAIAVVVVIKRGAARQLFKPAFITFMLLAAMAPALWLTYNAIVYRNPLEFANGPYSAKAIEKKTATPGMPAHPGDHDLLTSAIFFLKSGELNIVQRNWHRLWLGLALLGTLTVLLFDRRIWPLLLLWIPLPFYMLSVAYSGVPIFMPTWWPHSYYNVRYGVQLLPVFAVFVSLVAFWILEFFRSTKARTITVLVIVVLVLGTYIANWRATPISFQEAWINSRTRIVLETELAKYLQALPPDATILMYLGDHGGALQRAAFPLLRVIHEGNHRTWIQPTDPEGLWERALVNPEQFADFVIAMDGDAVSQAVPQEQLSAITVIQVLGQPRAVIYQTHKRN